MNKQTKALIPDLENDIILASNGEVESFTEHIKSLGYQFHHTAIRNGYAPLYVTNETPYAFIKRYCGIFGEGFMMCKRRSYSTVFCSYYVKEVIRNEYV